MNYEVISIETARIMSEIEKENKELQDRIEKAIDYIDRRDIDWGSDEHTKLLNILKGEKDE